LKSEEVEKGAGMKSGFRARLFCGAPLCLRVLSIAVLGMGLLGCGFLAGCKNFWAAPAGSSGFTLANGGNITVTAGATSGNTSQITVTPENSFTGTVNLTCAVTTSLSSPTSPVTCSLSPTSVSISGTTAETAAVTAVTTPTTTSGTYNITVTGASSGYSSETTTVCVAVGSSASCSGSSGGGGGSGNSGVFYVLNQTTDQVVALSISSGQQLNTIGAYTLPAPLPYALAVAPNGQFLYVSTADGIYLYSVGSNGALTQGNGGTRISGDPATAMQVDATNSWLVEAISGTNELFAIAINSSTGVLAAANDTEQPFSGGLPATTPTQLAISPNDSSSCTNCYVFVAMGAGGTELVHFNPSSANPFGTFGHISVLQSAGGDNTVAVDPQNRLLYVGESDALPSASQPGGLRVFTIGATNVPEIGGSPYNSGGTGPSSILPTADGNYVFVANKAVSGTSNDNIAGFSVTSSSLTSTGSATGAGPTGPISVAEDSTHGFVLAVDLAGNPDLQAYTLISGTLTSTLTGATGTDPVGAIGIAAAPAAQ
jgi:hypothetical protein